MGHARESRFLARLAACALAASGLTLLTPAAALGHGATDPVATSYLAAIRTVPRGLRATVVDGDLRMWLSVPPSRTVLVLDYDRAPYVRFDRHGVQVNEHSVMYYLNLTPPALPPPGLSAGKPPHWIPASGGHAYEWHDGRLQDLAAQTLLPGQRYLGSWRIPLLVDGRPAQISGAVFFGPAPSPVWFWPVAVIVLCVLAAWRLKRPELDDRLARALAACTLAAQAAAAAARWLHGRPEIAAVNLAELVAALLVIGWAARRVASRRAGGWTLLLITTGGFWFGLTLLPTLLHGYTLLAIPAFPARAVTVVLLGGSASLVLILLRLAAAAGHPAATAAGTLTAVLIAALGLAGCGAAASRPTTAVSRPTTHRRPTDTGAATLPATLIAQARPIGVGPRFHPPATGRPIPPCRPTLGRRYGVHLEVFRGNRVVLVAPDLGRRPGCFGAAVTLDPTGVLDLRPGQTVTLGQVFAAWGVPLRGRVYLNGRAVRGVRPAADLALHHHDEVVVETGPFVPPHRTYRFPAGL